MFQIHIDQYINDIRIEKGKIVLVSGNDAVIERVRHALSIELSEWPLDITIGIPYYGINGNIGILGSKKTAAEIQARISAIILSQPDVSLIRNFSFDRQKNRRLNVTVEILLSNGQTETLEL